jgi:hypothetical protein
MAAVLEGKSIGLDTETVQKESCWFGEPRTYGQRYSPTQGFDLLLIRTNWFLGNWTLDPCLKWTHNIGFHSIQQIELSSPLFHGPMYIPELWMIAPFFYCSKIKWDIVWALQTTCSTPKQLLSSIKVWKSQKASKQSTKLPCHFSGAFLFVFL